MNKPVRFTPEKQQELISRNQFCERIVQFGWIPVSPEDLGEDFIVHIYFEGQATGASFYVQEKSIVDLTKRRKGDFLPYSFEVKDLIHWEKFVQPVMLLIWDINLREGRWALLKDVIKHIEQIHPKWRTQKKTRVYIPWNNITNNDGLVKLRHKIGELMFPIIGKDKELDMKMNISLPDSKEGMEVAESLRKLYDDGEEVTLKGDFIKSIEYPDWAKPWLDTDFVEIKIESSGSPDSLPVDVNIISADGRTETMKGIELKNVKSGMQTIHLSNEHQTTPLKFDFVFSSSKDCRASVLVNNLGGNVNVTRDILRFKQALSVGGKLQLFSIKHGKPLPVDIPIPSQLKFGPDPNFIKLVDYLCIIQAKTGQFIKLESDVFSKQDLQTIDELLTIIEHGKLRATGKKLNRQFEVKPPENILDHLQQRKPITLTVIHPNSSGELLGQKIEMGKAIEQITGTLDMTRSELEKTIEIHKAEGILSLQLIDAESIVTFSNWIKEENKENPL